MFFDSENKGPVHFGRNSHSSNRRFDGFALLMKGRQLHSSRHAAFGNGTSKCRKTTSTLATMYGLAHNEFVSNQ